MKRLPWILPIIACCGFLCGAASTEFIRWLNVNDSIQVTYMGNKIEFGLRNDGVVVWREIPSTTNSPSGQFPFRAIIYNHFDMTNNAYAP